jgi:hypothetical protein
MTYALGGLIQATDYNNFINDTNKLNTYWGQGTGDAGYGQTAVGTVAVGNTVTATQWASLLNSLNNARKHQQYGSYTPLTVPVAGNRVDFISALSNTITDGYNFRLSRWYLGTTITGTNDVQNTFYAPGQSGTIYDYQEFNTNRTATVTFSSSDAARYFFNAGGYLSLYISAADNAGTNRSNALQSCIGAGATSGLRYIQEFAYTTNSGPYNYTSRDTNWGYYDNVYGTWNALAILYAGSPYGTTYCQIVVDAGSNDTTRGSKGNIVRFRVNMYAPADSPYGGNINITTTFRVDITPPSTTFLTDSWGTPTISWSTV